MNKLIVFSFLAFLSICTKAQFNFNPIDTSWKEIYRGSEPLVNDLVHTKLDVKFDFSKSYLYGKAWITLKPHFYSTDSLRLDAKGMNINNVALISKRTSKEPHIYL